MSLIEGLKLATLHDVLLRDTLIFKNYKENKEMIKIKFRIVVTYKRGGTQGTSKVTNFFFFFLLKWDGAYIRVHCVVIYVLHMFHTNPVLKNIRYRRLIRD